MKSVSNWVKRPLNDPQVALLLGLLAGITVIIAILGQLLAPVLAGIVLAYLLEGPVQFLQRLRLPRLAAVVVVYALFGAFALTLLIWLLPLLSGQLIQLVQQLPSMLEKGYAFLQSLPDEHPELITNSQALQIVDWARGQITSLSQAILSWSLASVVGIFTIAVYLVLVPLLVFFFLKDKDQILAWLGGFLPEDYSLLKRVWRETDVQIGNFIRGKFWEILIVWAVSFAVFAYLELRYAMLLGLMAGLSVLIPYIGALLATLPILLVGYFQWGWGTELMWLLAAYGIIQFLDGNVLVPVMFSEVVDLHPVAIIVAILVFGGLWGFWGVFFSIPLATVVQAVLKVWPRRTVLKTPPAAAPGEAYALPPQHSHSELDPP